MMGASRDALITTQRRLDGMLGPARWRIGALIKHLQPFDIALRVFFGAVRTITPDGKPATRYVFDSPLKVTVSRSGASGQLSDAQRRRRDLVINFIGEDNEIMLTCNLHNLH